MFAWFRLDKIKPVDPVILVVGPTGVGKSTWINSMAMYLSFDDFAHAENAEISDFNLIPTDYVRRDDNFEEISIKIGQSENEVRQPGQSHTVKPKAHSFVYKRGRTVTFIDTPGIADTGGIDSDKKNMQAIINSIKGFSHINLIVFLLKPNESRLTEEFVFCFKELIKQFHRNAATNIAFAFTNSVNTHFKPGDTCGLLKKLLNDIKEERDIDIPLNKNTMYFFDNVSYEYFCVKATTDRITFSKEEIKSYKNSYDKSRNELLRVVEHAEKVTPHNPQESVKLNLSQNVIQKLSGHVVKIFDAVRKTKEKIKEREDIIKEFEGKENELEKRLYYPVTIVRCFIEKRRKVFCRKCAESVIVSGDALHPYIEADPSLAGKDTLELFRGGKTKKVWGIFPTCPKCGFGFNLEMSRKTYYTYPEEEMQLDVTVDDQIKRIEKNKSNLEVQIEKEKFFKDEINKELDTILKACAKFAAYLKKNSIISYDDETDGYLHIAMDNEEKKNGKQSDHYKNLSQMLKEYHAMKEILEKTYNTSEDDEDIMLEDVQQIITELCNLKYYGKDIASALENVINEKSIVEKFGQLFVPVPLRESLSKMMAGFSSLKPF